MSSLRALTRSSSVGSVVSATRGATAVQGATKPPLPPHTGSQPAMSAKSSPGAMKRSCSSNACSEDAAVPPCQSDLSSRQAARRRTGCVLCLPQHRLNERQRLPPHTEAGTGGGSAGNAHGGAGICGQPQYHLPMVLHINWQRASSSRSNRIELNQPNRC